MKRFIVLMIFAIGLFVSLPSTSSGSGSPPDQVSLMQGQAVDFTAMVVNQEVKVFEVSQVFKVSCTAMVVKEGGCFVNQSHGLELHATYKNDKNATFKATGNRMWDDDDILTCFSVLSTENPNLKNIESRSRCTIRADSQV